MRVVSGELDGHAPKIVPWPEGVVTSLFPRLLLTLTPRKGDSLSVPPKPATVTKVNNHHP